MSLRQIQNLLPKKLTDRVALKTLGFEHQLSRLRGLRKQLKLRKFTRLLKLAVISVLSLYFTGYQPVLAIPPLKQSVVSAEFSQQQTISGASFAEPFILPHPGYISTRFSRWHPGIDIATGYGMPIHPVNKGVVVEAVAGWIGWGHYVIIEHEQGIRSTYGHMGNIYVKVGDPVDSSSTIGTVGMTGRTTGPHTHLEITKNGSYIDPLTILPPLPDWPNWQQPAPQGEGEVKGKQVEKSEIEKEVKPKTDDLKLKMLPINLQNVGLSQTKEDEAKLLSSGNKLKLPLLQWFQ